MTDREPEWRPALPGAAVVRLVALLAAETTINYLDRQALSVLAPVLRDEFRLSNTEYASVINAFMVVYMVPYALGGWVMDRLGVVRGLTLAVAWWSAGALTGLARGPLGLGVCRSLLAVGSGGAWPSFAKAVALWVPPPGRAQDADVRGHGALLGGHHRRVRALAVLDHDSAVGGGLLLDVLVGHHAHAARRVLPAARGGLGLRIRRDRLDHEGRACRAAVGLDVEAEGHSVRGAAGSGSLDGPQQ